MSTQVRVSDVYPTGEARLIQDSAVRMRWRNGGLTPEYLEPNVPYAASISLWNTSYVVAKGVYVFVMCMCVYVCVYVCMCVCKHFFDV